MRYVGGMKQKTSITLSEELVRELDRRTTGGASRSAYIEGVLRDHFRRVAWETAQNQDREILDRRAEALNDEMEDVLTFGAPWPGEG